MPRPPNPPPKNVHEAVRALRKRAGMSQQLFATRLGVSISALQNYERDQMPEPRALLRFAVLAQDGGYGNLFHYFGSIATQLLTPPGWMLQMNLEKNDRAEQPEFDIRWPRKAQS